MFTSRKQLQEVCNELMSDNEYMKSELAFLGKEKEEEQDFLDWVNENILPHYVILYPFLDKYNNISFVVCDKETYKEIHNERFKERILYVISPLIRSTVERNKNRIIEKDVPSAEISIERDATYISLNNIQCGDYQKQYYGTALMNCIKIIMRHHGLNKIYALLSYVDCRIDGGANRNHWYKKNGFEVTVDNGGNGTAKYIENDSDLF